MRLFLLGIVVLQLAGASAVDAASQPEVQEQRNSDGSWLRLTQTEQPAQGRRLLKVDLRTSANAPYAPLLQRSQVLAEFPRGRGRLEDIDGDGLWEFVETGFCGAGPNCVQTIFKVNPQRKTAWRFLHGGFFTVRRIGAFVVTAGRSSCCSWVHQAYRIPAGERTITDQDLAYSISVSGPLDKGLHHRAMRDQSTGRERVGAHRSEAQTAAPAVRLVWRRCGDQSPRCRTNALSQSEG